MQPGDRLPPQRGLAQHLGVDLTTVTRAYAEAGQRGLLEPRGPLGTFIARPAEQPLLHIPEPAEEAAATADTPGGQPGAMR